MVKKNNSKLNPAWIVFIIFMGLVDMTLLIMFLVKGKNVALFNPQGSIANQQYSLMIFTVELLLVFAIPVVFTLFFFAWKYRESNVKASHSPTLKSSKSMVIVMWVIPATFIIILASVMWPATHKLAPQKNIQANEKPIKIQVISMRWKWLFLYPEQRIATVNYVQIPVNTPVEFDMTADEIPMSSFWIPNLGGQLYTMTSHVNRLNLIADSLGNYPGSTPEINGDGFAGMKFNTNVSSMEEFNNWVQKVRANQVELDKDKYASLLVPSQNNPPSYFSNFSSDIYGNVLAKYLGSNGGHAH